MDINKYIGEKIRHYRMKMNLSQEELGDELGTSGTNISRYESGERGTNNDILFAIGKILNVSISDFFPPINNAVIAEELSDMIEIPVLGYIKAGLPIEAQEDIIEYIKIPRNMTVGGKEFFGLRISGNSMSPNYNDGDTVIFEKTNDYIKCNHEDCAVMVNHTECTFKQFVYRDDGVTLIPYNTKEYEIRHYSRQEVMDLPISIIGVAVEIRTKIKRKNPDYQE